MFSNGLQSAKKYTYPIICTKLRFNGDLQSSCGTLIVINKDGWIVTAAHIMRDIELMAKHAPEIADYEQKKSEIENDPKLDYKRKKKRIGKLPNNREWIVKQAALWGFAQCKLSNPHIDDFADIAIGQLAPFDPSWVAEYPIFKNPSEPMPTGTSLCRLGFPFHEIKATYDSATDEFKLQEGILPVPRFPNDGIHTRVILKSDPNGSRVAKLIETSTPGLRGQSGGPIFDTNGNIWAIQNQTQSLDLGFATSEKQYLHVGWGSHVEEVINLLKANGISFTLSS